MGAGRDRRGDGPRRTPPRSTCTTRSSPGSGSCDVDAVHRTGPRGPLRVRELVALGAEFDRDAEGEILLTREGGHHRDRIAHAGGDATGKRDQPRPHRRAAPRPVDDPGIEVDRARARRRPAPGRRRPRVRGDAARHRRGPGRRRRGGPRPARSCSPPAASARSTPRRPTRSVATGDGMAAALRAGAVVADLEFVQFHPTVLWLGRGLQRPAAAHLRGGARRGRLPRRRSTACGSCRGSHELADLAPRDVVARAIVDADAPDRHRPRLPRRPPPRARSSSSSGSPRSSPGAASSASTRPPSCCRSRPPSTTPAAASRPTSSGAPRLDGLYACGEARAPASTAPTGSRPTRCSRGSSSRTASPTTSPPGSRPARLPTAAGRRRAAPGPPADVCSTRPHRLDVQRAMTRGSGPVRSGPSTAAARCDALATSLASRLRHRRTPTRPDRPPGRRPTCSTSGRPSPQVAPCARRPAAGTCARTSPSATTRTGCATRCLAHRRRDGQRRTPVDQPANSPSRSGPMERPSMTDLRLPRPATPCARAPRALDEDLGTGHLDVTTMATIPARPGAAAHAVVARADGVVAGLPVVALVLDAVATRLGAGRRRGHAARSTTAQRVARGDVARDASTGPTRAVLVGERTVLNILCRAVRRGDPHPALGRRARGHRARWCSTPARPRRGCARWRSTPCAAAAGTNKRMGLYDVAMIKDNHKLAAGRLTAGVRRGARPTPTSPSRSR